MGFAYIVVDFSFDGSRAQPVQIFEIGELRSSDILALDELRKQKDQPTIQEQFDQEIAAARKRALFFEEENQSAFGLHCVPAVRVGSHTYNYEKNYAPRKYEGIIELAMELDIKHPGLSKQPLAVSISNTPDLSLSNLLDHYAERFTSAEHSPRILAPGFLSGALVSACSDKAVLWAFCQEANCMAPSFLVDLTLGLPSQQKGSTLEDFLSTAPSTVILKPTNRARGKGFHVISKENMLSILDEIYLFQSRDQGLAKGEEELGEYWKNRYERDQWVLLQHCSPSSTIIHNNQVYIPTGRAVIRCDAEGMTEVIDGFWKLPFHTAGENLKTDTVKSFSGETDQFPAALINPGDWSIIKNLLETQFCPIVHKISKTRISTLLERMRETPNLARYVCHSGRLDVRQSYLSSFNIQELIDIWSSKVVSYFCEIGYGSGGSMEVGIRERLMFSVGGLADSEIEDALRAVEPYRGRSLFMTPFEQEEFSNFAQLLLSRVLYARSGLSLESLDVKLVCAMQKVDERRKFKTATPATVPSFFQAKPAGDEQKAQTQWGCVVQ